MTLRSACLSVCLAWFLCAAPAVAQAPIEEVLVTGEHPGPGLWKVYKGDHALWILGTHSPLPQDMTWRSEEVESVIAESQEVLGSYSVSLAAPGGANGLQSKGSKLQSVLPARAYSRWQALRRKYIPRNVDTEKMLPAFAAILLQQRAFEQSGLTYTNDVWRAIYVVANKYRVPVNVSHQVHERAPDGASGRSPRVGVDYLVRTMDRLEGDLRTARSRANAWATGDVDALKNLAAADQTTAYMLAYSWPFVDEREVSALLTRADRRWLQAAEAALDRNQTTFAALPIYLILKPDGLLAQLETRGYEVEAPH